MIGTEKIEIIRATYGPPNAEKKAPWQLRFVTSKLQNVVNEIHETSKKAVLITERLNGIFGDPSPGIRKVLEVRYRIKGLEIVGNWAEGSPILLQKGEIQGERTKLRAYSDKRNMSLLSGDLLDVIVSFLPVFPDRFACLLVSKTWNRTILATGLTKIFRIGQHGMPGPCYLDMDVALVKYILLKSCFSLVELDLSDYTRLRDSMIIPVLQNSKNLKSLFLNYCIELTDKSIGVISESNALLEELEIKGLMKITDNSIKAIASKCLCLRSVNLSDCCHLTDESVSLVISNLPDLIVLYLKHCHKVTDKSIRHVGASGKVRLQELGLWLLHLLTDAAFSGIERADMSSLKSLVLTGCINLTFESIKLICTRCINLLQFNLSFCHRLDDKSIIFLAEHLLKLEHLNLHYLISITDQSLLTIADRLKYLRSLNLSMCRRLSPQSVVAACRNLPQLNELFLRNNQVMKLEDLYDLVNAVQERGGVLDLLDLRETFSISNEEEFAQLLSESFGYTYRSHNNFFYHATKPADNHTLRLFQSEN